MTAPSFREVCEALVKYSERAVSCGFCGAYDAKALGVPAPPTWIVRDPREHATTCPLGMARAAIAGGGWKRVEDGLPESNKYVLVRSKAKASVGVDIARLVNGRWVSHIWHKNITHWYEFQDPPHAS